MTGHHHHHGAELSKEGQKKIQLAIWLNILITLSQIVGGFLTGSLSILSDSLHNFSDVIALIVSLLALWLASKPYSLERTFGYKRAEIVAALVNIITLVIVGVLLIIEAFQRLWQGQQTIESAWMIGLALFGFLINAYCGFILHEGKNHSLNLKVVYLHLVSDALTSLTIAVGAVVMLYTEAYWIDSVLTPLISIYLLFVAYRSLVEILHIIMHFVPYGLDLKEIEQAILENHEIQGVHHVHLWQINDVQIHFEAHLDFKKDLKISEAHKIIKNTKNLLNERFKINHTIFQSETNAGHDRKLVPED